MRKAILSELKPGEQLILILLVFIVTGLVFYGLAAVVAVLISHLTFSEVFQLMAFQDDSHLLVKKLVQIIMGFGNYTFAAMLFSWLVTGSWTAIFRGEGKPGIISILLALLTIFSALPVINFLTEFNSNISFASDAVNNSLVKMEETAEQITWILTSAENGWELALNILMIAFLPGIGEELIFRGLIQKNFTRIFRNGHIAIFVTAVIFSAIHLQFLSFLPRLILGIILGYLFYYGKSIWYPIIAHTANNFLGVIFYFKAHREGGGEIVENIGTHELFPWSAVLSLLVLLIVFYAWYKNLKVVSQASQSGPVQKD